MARSATGNAAEAVVLARRDAVEGSTTAEDSLAYPYSRYVTCWRTCCQ